MKLQINGKEVDLVINGEQPDFLATKVRVMDHGIIPDDLVRKKREEIAKAEVEENEQD
jgi:hypothetical protein